MTPKQVELVQRSFTKIPKDKGVLGEVFYKELFFQDSSLKKLFPSDMNRQAERLEFMLQVIVTSLDEFARVAPYVSSLGARHSAYGVKLEHFVLVKRALLLALEQLIPNGLDGAAREAWESAYDVVAVAMLRGMTYAF